MNIDTLKEKLADIDADTLRNFIFDPCLRYPELSDKIEALTLANGPDALSKVLGKRIASLRRWRRFIDYRASFDVARELDFQAGGAHHHSRFETRRQKQQSQHRSLPVLPRLYLQSVLLLHRQDKTCLHQIRQEN
jgi:hypothetical protein